jgi:hypothetical protein
MRAGLCHALVAILAPWAAIRAADVERAPVRQADLQRHLEFLASDTLEGREAGSSGGRAAAGYLSDQLRRIGLNPAGDGDRYVQEFGAAYRNVLAILPGADANLNRQFVLIGAHYDHVGYGRRGNTYGPVGYIHNGADDNASGTAALLEIAESLAAAADLPRRSILFAWWDAEEINLNGSEHWRANPTRPLSDVRLVINVDMIGRLRDDTVVIHGIRTGAGLRSLLAWTNAETRLCFDFRRAHIRDSDHYPFFRAGIPYLAFDTGKHPDYHRPTDDVDRLNVAGIEQIARCLAEFVRSAADQPILPEFRPESVAEATQTDPDLLSQPVDTPVRLGLSWNARRAGEPVRVRQVDSGSPADLAGIRSGDSLVGFAGRATSETPYLATLVAMTASPADVVVLRPGLDEPLRFRIALRGEPVTAGYLVRHDPAEPGINIVAKVLPGSPAARAGLLPGDRVLNGVVPIFAREDSGEQSSEVLIIDRRGRIERLTWDDSTVGP